MRGTRTSSIARTVLLGLLLLGLAAFALAGCTQSPTGGEAASTKPADATQAKDSSMGGMESDDYSQGCSACTTGEEPAPATGDVETIDGAQVVTVGIVEGYYTPNQFSVKAVTPVKVVFKVEGKPAKACVSKPTFKSLDKMVMVTTGEKSLELGVLEPGSYEFSCGMGSNKGTITVQ